MAIDFSIGRVYDRGPTMGVRTMGTAYEVAHDGRDRAGWLRRRQDGIGGSDAAAILGVSPWSSALEVYVDKVGLVGDDDGGSEYARWGRKLEPIVLEEFRARTGRPVKREGRLLRSRRRPWQLTTLDARQHRPGTSGPGLLEVKTTMFGWERIPEDLWAQLQHQFSVTGFGWGSFAVWNRTTCEFNHIDVEPDRDYIGEMIEAEATFWTDLCAGKAPEPDSSEGTARALRVLYPEQVAGKVIQLNAEIEAIADELEACKVDAKGLDATKKRCETDLKAAIGDAEVGELPSGASYTFKVQHRREVVQAAASFRVLRRKGG